MKPSVSRGKRKQTVQPVIVTTENAFKPKISERTIRRRQEQREQRLRGGKLASGLDICGIICLYIFLILAVLIGAGGIAVCSIYMADEDTQAWKIAGIAMGAATSVIGIILVLLTIFKQTRNRPWRYKKKEITYEDYYNDMDSDDDDDNENRTEIETFYDNRTRTSTFLRQSSTDDRKNVSQSAHINSPEVGKTRETASSPIQDPSVAPLNLKTTSNEMIFCPGCNREHPTSHQCMYSTRVANGFSTQFGSKVILPAQDTIAIQTEDDAKGGRLIKSRTLIDRSLKYSNTTETQTDVSANPRSNITESIILRRVPIPTAKVVVQQPTTKVMIVKVPSVAGQLVIQPKSGSTDN